jgi:tetratricopeptide (TPR) repeat protein
MNDSAHTDRYYTSPEARERAQAAFALLRLGRLNEALAEVDQFVADNPHEMYPAYCRATMIIGNCSYLEAESVVEWFEARFPEEPYRHYLRGRLLVKLGRKAEALEAFRTHLAETEPNDQTIDTIADLMIDLGRLEDAEQLLARSSKLGSSITYFRLHPPRSRTEVDRMADSLRDAGQPDFEVAVATYSAFQELGEIGAARSTLEAYLVINPANEWANICLAIIEDSMGEKREAIARMKGVLDINPRNERATVWLMTLMAKRFNLIAWLRTGVKYSMACAQAGVRSHRRFSRPKQQGG